MPSQAIERCPSDSWRETGTARTLELMIVREKLPLRRVWPQVSKRLSLLFLYDLTIAVLYTQANFTWLAQPMVPLTMMGAGLSLFLAFRNNSAYDRWWEARTLWGGLVNHSRTLARQALTLISDGGIGSRDPRRELVGLQIAYVHALRCHLRKQNPFPELTSMLPEETITRLRGEQNVPAALLLIMGETLREAFEAGLMDSIRYTAIDQTLTELCNVQGGCERIKNTPLPRQYEYGPRLMVRVFCLLVPIGLVEGLGLLTPIASTALSLLFILLEAIGKEIENPFENTIHDTPMSSLSRTIEINLRQNLGERNVPEEVKPVEGFVY
jgi:putative membrane protein